MGTHLRDDGYLQTDDPVVLSCFLDEEVEVHTYDLSIHRGPLEYVGGDYCGIEVGGRVGHYYFEECKDNPILIPAKELDTLGKTEHDYIHAKLAE